MSSNGRGSRSKKNIFSKAWNVLKGKRGSREASSSRTYRDAATSPASSLAEPQRNYRDAATSPLSWRSSSKSQSRASSRKSSEKSSPVESRRRSSSVSQSDGHYHNSGEDDPWRASYRHGTLAYSGDYDQGRVRSYPRPPQQEYDYSYHTSGGQYYSRGIDNVNSYVRDDASVPSYLPPHNSYGYHRPSESPPNNCVVM